MIKDVYSYLKNLFYVFLLFCIFGTITFGFDNACKIKKQADKYDSINQYNKKVDSGNGVQQYYIQDSDSLYIDIYDSSDNNNN